MRGKLLLLLGVLFFSQVAVAEIVQDVQVSSASEKIEFEPRYNAAIREDKLEYLDKKRISRIKREYNLDWYFSYCGDPRDVSSRDDFKCRFKLENLSEVEERSLLVYKTNFLDTGFIDPRLKQKFFEIVEDVRDNGDKGKYGRQSEFIYSPDVMLGIIFMEQTSQSLAEYKWAYAKVRYLYNEEELSKVRDLLNSRERNLRIVESEYERERLLLLQKKYNFSVVNERCGREDYTGYFEGYGESDEEDDGIPSCIIDNAGIQQDDESYYYFYTLCTCKPEIRSFVDDFSLEQLKSVLVVYFNDSAEDTRYYTIDIGILGDIQKVSMNVEKYREIVEYYLSRDILLGMVTGMGQGYIEEWFKRKHLLLMSDRYENQMKKQDEE